MQSVLSLTNTECGPPYVTLVPGWGDWVGGEAKVLDRVPYTDS